MDHEITHTASKQLHALLKGVGIFASGSLFLMAITLLGPIIEGTYFPVTRDMEAQYIETIDRRMYFSVQANRVRECALIDVKALVDKDIKDVKKPMKGAAWEVNYDVSPYRIHTGYQDLGVWAVIPEGDRVFVSAVWHCHPFWNTQQLLGQWDRPRKETK